MRPPAPLSRLLLALPPPRLPVAVLPPSGALRLVRFGRHAAVVRFAAMFMGDGFEGIQFLRHPPAGPDRLPSSLFAARRQAQGQLAMVEAACSGRCRSRHRSWRCASTSAAATINVPAWSTSSASSKPVVPTSWPCSSTADAAEMDKRSLSSFTPQMLSFLGRARHGRGLPVHLHR